MTLCFPGTPQNATCAYHVETNATTPEITAQLPPQPCPQDFLFDHPCKTLVGTVYFAFGPCNVDDVPEEPMANNTMDVSGWIKQLGLGSVEVSS